MTTVNIYKTKLFIAAFAGILLIGCGGGGADTIPGPGNSVPPPPEFTAVVSPFTGDVLPGQAVQILHGETSANASVTAYNVNPDGSSGAALGPTIKAGIGGDFSMKLDTAPMGWVRLVSEGGTIVHGSVDASVQPAGTMELVTPYVTSSYNNFAIDALSDIAAKSMLAQVKRGAALPKAFQTGMQNALMLDIANTYKASDLGFQLQVLSGEEAEVRKHIILGLQFFGLMYDLPAIAVRRAAVASAEVGFQLAAPDIGGASHVNVGTWVNGAFDLDATMTLKAVMNAMTPRELHVRNPVTNEVEAPGFYYVVSTYMIADFLVYQACWLGNASMLTARYPWYYVIDNKVQQADCLAVASRMHELKGRIETNNVTKMRGSS